MAKLDTVFTSNIPIDCHLIKGRLEIEGIPCAIFDENIVWANPFNAVLIGGVKVKVPTVFLAEATQVLDKIQLGQLTDELGDYPLDECLQHDILKQNEVLHIKTLVIDNLSVDVDSDLISSSLISTSEINEIRNSVASYIQLDKLKFVFSWKQFWYELFDFDRSIYTYLRVRPVEYYQEKASLTYYNTFIEETNLPLCPNCNSTDINYGFEVGERLKIGSIIFFVLLGAIVPLFRQKYHCFHCGSNFKFSKDKPALKVE